MLSVSPNKDSKEHWSHADSVGEMTHASFHHSKMIKGFVGLGPNDRN